jgi:hypothetical protein
MRNLLKEKGTDSEEYNQEQNILTDGVLCPLPEKPGQTYFLLSDTAPISSSGPWLQPFLKRSIDMEI